MRTMVLLMSVLAVATGTVRAGETDGGLREFTYREVHMGVVFTLRLYAPDVARANRAARAAFGRVRELNAMMSDYDPDSELARLSNAEPVRPVPVSPELAFVLGESQELSQQSGGAFDVTVGPVVKLWRAARRSGEMPSPEALAVARAKVGHRLLRVDRKRRTVTLEKAGMALDLGGIAKGYAGDEMLRVLREHGVTRAMVDASGDIVAGDPPPGREAWRIGVAPLSPDAPPSRLLCLKNTAVATSGDAFQFVEIGGRRYSHIIDPQTGLGLTRRSSVTVIARHGYQADALASAVSVLGPEQGFPVAEKLGAEALVVLSAGEGEEIRQFATAGFADFECPAMAESP
jgi:thiamine biosynthesis lipoprotein